MKRYTILTMVLLLTLSSTVCLASDGTVRNASNATIGKVESDGTVRNASNAAIGKISFDKTMG